MANLNGRRHRAGLEPERAELFYRDGRKMMSVEISTQSGFNRGKPRMLFEGPYLPSPATTPNYAVSPDGQHFLMLKKKEAVMSSASQVAKEGAPKAIPELPDILNLAKKQSSQAGDGHTGSQRLLPALPLKQLEDGRHGLSCSLLHAW
jgi:hypothetical protein